MASKDIDLYDYIIKLIMPAFVVCVAQYFNEV